MKLSFLVLSPGKMQGKSIPIDRPEFFIGRDPKCQLRPASPNIGKRHCAVMVRGGKVYLRDFSGGNGTFVNRRQAKGDVELTDNDHLKVGPLEFKVRIDAAPAATPEFLQPFMGGIDDETTEFVLPPELAAKAQGKK